MFFWKKKDKNKEIEETAASEVSVVETAENAESENLSAEAPAENAETEDLPVEAPVENVEAEKLSAEAPVESAETKDLSAEELVRNAEAESLSAAAPVESAEAEYLPVEEAKPVKKKKSGIFGAVLTVIFILLLIIGGCYYYGLTYARTHFLENTYINEQDVSNMTVPEVEKLLYGKADDYSITLKFKDGYTEKIDGQQFGYKIKPDGSVAKILDQQDPYHWYKCFSQRMDAEVEIKTTYDPVALRQVVKDLPIMQEDDMVKPSDAYIVLSEDTFEIVPEVEGTYFSTKPILKAVDDAAKKRETEVDVAALGVYEEPKVRADNEELVAKCEDLNHMIAGSMTWILPSGEEMTIDKEITIDWLSKDDDGNYYRDEDLWEDKVAVYVDELAMKVNTVGTEWDFHATNVGDITVSGGDYGYSVNKVDERDDVFDVLWDGDTDEREPYYYSKEFQGNGSGIGSTYIEANLSQQHVWIYVDGKMVIDTPCVSGNTGLGRGTPTGVYQILYKDTDVELKGIQLGNGQYSYISHVDYWMPFYSGCGFHDASWRSNFGGTIYKYDGSHGCINLPPSVAPEFYSYVTPGMPVVVFY